MHLYKSEIVGLYRPTFFSLLIDKENVLNEKNQIKDEFGNIFFHEYIHFLQDILTSYGLRNIITLIQEYSIINHEIINSNQSFFSIPYVSSDENLNLSKTLISKYWGTPTINNDNRDFEIVKISYQPYLLNEKLKDLKLVDVEIFYRDNFERDSFYLGAIHFLENMAHLIERNYSFEKDNIPYPYKVIEKIIKSFFSNNCSDRDLIVFMENALDTFNPAEYLISFIDFCTNGNLTFSEHNIKTFYRKFVVQQDAKKYKLDKYYFHTISLAKEGFNAMFNHEKLSKMNLWADVILSNAVKLKRNNFTFSSLLVQNFNFEQVQQTLSLLIKKLGTPIIADRNNSIFLSSPSKKISEDEMIYLLGLEAVINVLGGERKCALIPYCSHGPSGDDITNELCYKTPWLRTEQKPLCLFAQFWIMWGFVKKEVH